MPGRSLKKKSYTFMDCNPGSTTTITHINIETRGDSSSKKYVARDLVKIPRVIWIYGPSCVGKSDLAGFITQYLLNEIRNPLNPYCKMGVKNVIHMDGDSFRKGLCCDLSLTMVGRKENIRRAAELAKLLITQNNICVCSFVTPLREHRDLIRDTFCTMQIHNPVYFVYLYCADGELITKRDKKGIYKYNNPFIPTVVPPSPIKGDRALCINTGENNQAQTRSILIKALEELWYEPLKQ